jgi:hypothetical protein
MHYSPFLSLLLLAAGQAVADDPLKLPAEVKGEVGRFLFVRGETPGKSIRWACDDPSLQVIPAGRLADPKEVAVVGVRPGRFTLWAWSAVEGEPTDRIAVSVVIAGQAPDPGPAPPPDGLRERLRKAYQADPAASNEKAKDLVLLSELYRQFADLIEDPAKAKTAGQLLGILRAASQSLAASSLLPVRQVMAAELAGILPTEADAELSASQRQRAAELFRQAASYLGDLK